MMRWICNITVALMLAALPAGSVGETAGKKTVGVIFGADIPHFRHVHRSVLRHLEERGVGPGSIRLLEQRPYPDVISWANAARKVIAYDADIILVYGAGPAKAVLRETSTTPVVYASVYAETSPAFRAPNAAGCSYRTSLSSFLRYLRKVRDIRDFAVVYAPFEEDSVRQFEAVRALCDELGVNAVPLPIRSRADIEGLLKIRRFDALLVTGSSLANREMAVIGELALKKGVPAASLFEGTEEHAFITISPDTEMQGAEIAEMLHALLRGESFHAGKEAVVTRTHVSVNMRVGNALGLRLPIELVTGAEKVIR